MVPLQLRPEEHRVVELPITRFFRRKLRSPYVLTWYNIPERTWVVGEWMSRPGNTVVEIGYLGPDIRKVDRKRVDELLWERSPAKLRWFRELKAQARSRRIDGDRVSDGKLQDWLDFQESIRGFLRRRSNSHQQDSPLWYSF